MSPPKLLEQYRERLRVKHYSFVLNKGGRGVKSPLDSGGAGQPPVLKDVAEARYVSARARS